MTGILYSLPARTVWFWRAGLLAGVVGAAAVAWAIGRPDALLRADPELASLMRGMALIKACLVLAALSAVAWRLKWPASRKVALGYLTGVWLSVAAAMLIWQLTFIALAAVVFHAGEGLLLVLAWRDREVLWAPRSRADRQHVTPVSTASTVVAKRREEALEALQA